jgi:hypothetical protein
MSKFLLNIPLPGSPPKIRLAAMTARNRFIPDIPFNQGRLVGFIVVSFSSTAN